MLIVLLLGLKMLVIRNDTAVLRAWWGSFYQKAFYKSHVLVERIYDVLRNNKS